MPKNLTKRIFESVKSRNFGFMNRSRRLTFEMILETFEFLEKVDLLLFNQDLSQYSGPFIQIEFYVHRDVELDVFLSDILLLC